MLEERFENAGVDLVNITETSSGLSLAFGVNTSGTGGQINLVGNNSYSGGTSINGGSVTAFTVNLGSNTALGSGTVSPAGGTLANSTAVTLSNAIFVVGGTTTVFDFSLANITLNGNINGSGIVTTKNVGNTNYRFLGGDDSGFTGTWTNGKGRSAHRRISAHKKPRPLQDEAFWSQHLSFNELMCLLTGRPSSVPGRSGPLTERSAGPSD